MLRNREGLWVSNDDWYFDTKDDFICIENLSKKKVLATSSDGEVILEDFEEGNAKQLWKKTRSKVKGYFTLENSFDYGIITAVSSSILQTKGNICLSYLIVDYLVYLPCLFI